MRHTRGPIPDFPRDRPTVADVQALVDEWVAAGTDDEPRILGGYFSYVLESGDVRASIVRWCLDQAHHLNDELGVRLAEALLSITKTQRLKLTLPYYRDQAA